MSGHMASKQGASSLQSGKSKGIELHRPMFLSNSLYVCVYIYKYIYLQKRQTERMMNETGEGQVDIVQAVSFQRPHIHLMCGRWYSGGTTLFDVWVLVVFTQYYSI